MTTISLINQKGGCGKSSTCFHLAGYFAQAGRRVLLIDADPQGSLSQGFLGSTLVENLAAEETLAALFADDLYVPANALTAPTPVPGIWLVRANQSLAVHNVPAPEATGLHQFALRSFLEELDFDLVLIDCPPNLYQCSWNALLASDFVIVPVPPEDFATQGLRAIHQAVTNAAQLHPLWLLGHLVTRADRRLLVHRAYERKLRALYGEAVLETVLPEASAFKVALSCRQPVTYYAPASEAARRVALLGQEILESIQQRDGLRGVA